jgi:hypothetical protein
MILLKANQLNKIVVTLTENSTLCDPEYLFYFVHIFSKDSVAFILPNISIHKERYDEFEFVEGRNVGEIAFPYTGEYNYFVYQQPKGSGNLDPLLSNGLVENGISMLIEEDRNTTNEYFIEYVSDDEFNSNTIFAPDELQPPSQTPSNTPSPTPTRTQTPTPTPTPTITPTPSITPTITPTTTPTLTPTPSSTPPPPLDPLSLGNLQHWYLSTSGATAASWTNLGLLGGSITQGNPAEQPSIITETLGSFTGTAVNYINGDRMVGGFTRTNFSSSTIFWIAKINSVDTARGWSIILGDSISGLNTGIQTFPLEIVKDPSSQFAPTLSIPELLLTASGTTNSFFNATFNDLLPDSTNPFTGGSFSDVFNLGDNQGQTTSDISIFEFLVYNRLLTNSEYAQVVNYLKTKYQYSTW